MLWNLVLVAERQGAPADAERFCALLASKSPESDAVAFRLGSLRFSQSDWAGSAAAFRATLKIKPDSPAAQLNLGLALWKSGKPDEARKALEAVSTAPFCVDALHYLAVIAADREDFAGALGYYKRLADSGERSAELLYNSALMLQNLGRSDEAAAQYRQALAVNPDLVEAKQGLAQVSKPEEPRKKTVGKTAAAPQLLKTR